MTEALVVFMTAGSTDEARRIADHLIDARLAACVQVLPEIESVYHWKGEVRREREVLILAKTTGGQFEALEAAVRAVHSYETPEIVAVPIAGISPPYRKWLVDSVS